MNSEVGVAPPSPKIWQSIDHVKPAEEGGPIARTGFNYQDEIAVGFLIEMLESPTLLKVHLETHDDLVLVRQSNSSTARSAEYVQVKASEPNKLWSVADLCQKKKGKEGASIFETSLGRDKHEEASTFRLVTLRDVVSTLKLLTFDFTAPSRAPESEGMKALLADLDTRFPNVTSPKENGASFWLNNCLWDVRHSEGDVSKDNLLRLIKLSFKENIGIQYEHAEMILRELRTMAKDAGAAKWDPDRDKKIILRENLRTWWEKRTDDLVKGPTAASGGKLSAKMNEAGLPSDLINGAVELRLRYAAEVRAPRYLEQDVAGRPQNRVLSEINSLQSQAAAGHLSKEGVKFHALCLERMDCVNAERNSTTEDQAAFLKGCMYDIADRCLLKFAR